MSFGSKTGAGSVGRDGVDRPLSGSSFVERVIKAAANRARSLHDTAGDRSVVRSVPASGGVGEIAAAQAWDYLQDHADAVLVDVRTRAEWSYVGIPDLDRLANRLVLLEWQVFPSMAVDPDFCPRLDAELGGRRDMPVLFLCRSGARSMSAAMAMMQFGYTQCLNVVDGFEGTLDGDRRRGNTNGWKAAGLPWVQT